MPGKAPHSPGSVKIRDMVYSGCLSCGMAIRWYKMGGAASCRACGEQSQLGSLRAFRGEGSTSLQTHAGTRSLPDSRSANKAVKWLKALRNFSKVPDPLSVKKQELFII